MRRIKQRGGLGKNRMKKRGMKTAAVLSALALLLLGVGTTLSYLSDDESRVNTFTVGDLELGLQEPDWDPEEGDGENVYPGYSVYKNPTVKNITSAQNGEEPCYVRMRILLADSGGNLITDSARLSLVKTMIRYDQTYTGGYDHVGTGKQIEQGRIPGYSLAEIEKLPMLNPLFLLDGERSRENELVCKYMGADGSGILQIGEEATLFTTLAVPTEWKNEEIALLGDFRIIVKAEAIQAAGFADQSAAFEALDVQMSAEEGG